MQDPLSVFIDTETCGRPNDSEMCDIGIIGLDGTVIFESLVKPYNPIPEDATAVHGITNDMVADAPIWDHIAGHVWEALDGKRVIIYNAQYDTGIVNTAQFVAGLPKLIHEAECAMLAYAAFAGVRNRFGQDFRWHKLEDAARRFGITPGGHRAKADAEATRQLVDAMANVRRRGGQLL
jgi:DNA polymerase-3 subunit epsilon